VRDAVVEQAVGSGVADADVYAGAGAGAGDGADGGQSGAGVAGVASGEGAHPAASAEPRFGRDHAEEEPFDELPISGSAVDPEAEAMSTWNGSRLMLCRFVD
jgi:hypothetical protein